MTGIRRHARAWATAWLLWQTLSLLALAPRDCCAAHTHRATARQAAAADAAACHDHAMHQPAPVEPECSLRGTCNGPTLALPLTTSVATVPVPSFTVRPDRVTAFRLQLPDAAPLAADLFLDPPPPRL